MIEHKDKHGNENMIEGRQIICSGRLPGRPGADDCT